MAGMNMQQMMKQARKMQEQLAAAQENLKSQTVDASAGGGMVKVTVNGEMELVNLTIDPDALDPEDVHNSSESSIINGYTPGPATEKEWAETYALEGEALDYVTYNDGSSWLHKRDPRQLHPKREDKP